MEEKFKLEDLVGLPKLFSEDILEMNKPPAGFAKIRCKIMSTKANLGEVVVYGLYYDELKDKTCIVYHCLHHEDGLEFSRSDFIDINTIISYEYTGEYTDEKQIQIFKKRWGYSDELRAKLGRPLTNSIHFGGPIEESPLAQFLGMEHCENKEDEENTEDTENLEKIADSGFAGIDDKDYDGWLNPEYKFSLEDLDDLPRLSADDIMNMTLGPIRKAKIIYGDKIKKKERVLVYGLYHNRGNEREVLVYSDFLDGLDEISTSNFLEVNKIIYYEDVGKYVDELDE